MTDQEEKAVLETWFKCDMNAVPPTYVLQPVSSHIPDHLCRDAKQRKLALQQWSQIFAQIQNILRREARKMFEDQEEEWLHKYFMSGNTPRVGDKAAFFLFVMNYPTYICTMWVPICLIKLDDTKWRKKFLLFYLNSRLRQSCKLHYLFARYYNNIISLTRCLKVKITFSIYCFFFSFFRKTRLADYRFSIRYEVRCLLVTKGWHEHS